MIITRGGADGQRASLKVCPGDHIGGIGSLGNLRKVCPGDHIGGIGSLGDFRKVCPGDMFSRLIGSVSRVA